ncbi:MAG: deoxyribonuclease IV [Elusimicrobia bacterium]|nr:deoxyribonuclease IV [Elusimicrobiota bacterium]
MIVYQLMFIGAHYPVRPTLSDALKKAQELGVQALQIFGYRRHEFYFDPKLPPQAKARLDDEIRIWRENLKKSAIKKIIVHARFVATLASGDPDVQRKFIAGFRQEWQLAKMLSAEYFVFHLGPYDESMDAGTGLKTAGEALHEILKTLPAGGPLVVLENVPGGGRRMGSAIEEWEQILGLLGAKEPRFGLCLDTAHLWNAGCDLSSIGQAEKFWHEFERRIGSFRLVLVHLSNSPMPSGCRHDLHSHLAEGRIPAEVYRYILKSWPAAAGIIETPRDAADADRKNFDFLRNL